LKSFEECRNRPEQGWFVRSLFLRIEQKLQGWMVAQSPSPNQQSSSHVSVSPGMVDEAIDPDAGAEELMHAWRHDRRLPAKLIDTRARETRIRDTLGASTEAKNQDHSVIALEALQKWVTDPDGASYCVILGEYGIGKTTTLKQFTEALLKRRRDGEDA